MITELTKDQIARFSEFIDKWTKIGLCTKPANRSSAEVGIVESYKIAGLNPPKIVWCGSPLSQGLTRALILGLKNSEIKIGTSVGASVRDSVRDSVGDSVWDSVGASVGASVGDSVGDSVWASVGASVGASVRDSVRDSVGDSVWASVGARVWASVRASVRDSVGASVWDGVGASVRDSVRDSVGDSVWDGVGASVWDGVGASVWDSVWASVYGQHDANWLGFYEYFKIVCSLDKETQKLCGIWTVAKNAGWWLPHQNLCWVSERHTTLCRNASGQLHKDGAMALAYPDGWGIFALNGVRMRPEHVLTPSEKLSPKVILTEANAEIRRELIRKVGMERFLAVCDHKSLEKSGDYELLSVPLSELIKDSRWLKMLNPSVGCWHVEAVPPGISTIESALNWREDQWFKQQRPEVLT